MKEVTTWNGHPRLMWVWDRDVRNKYKEYTVCILTEEELKEADTIYPVITSRGVYTHCAEIEEPKKRPCTREELIGMLKKQGLPMLKEKNSKENYTVVIRSFTETEITLGHGACYTSYENLCEQYTLIDGTELWVEE